MKMKLKNEANYFVKSEGKVQATFAQRGVDV
jgi:hypothetical protein